MVYFTKQLVNENRHLVILSNKNQPREGGLSLLVEKSWPDPFADHWPRLDNSSILLKLSMEISLSEGKNV